MTRIWPTLVALLLIPSAVLAQGAPPGADGTNLSLPAALAEADARNPDVLAAGHQIDVARAILTQTAPSPLSAQATQSSTQDVPQGLGALQTFSAGASQEFSPALGAQRRAAGSGISIASAQFAATRRDVDLRVITTYYGLASATAVVAAARESLANARQTVQSAQLRAKVGAVGSFEVLRATVESRRAEADLLRAQSSERSARIALNVLLGRPVEEPTVVALVAGAPASSDLETLFDSARLIDPLVAQYRATADQAIASARAARLGHLPTIAVNAGYLFQRAPDRGGVVSRGPTGGVTLSVPLFDYGTIRGAVREARAREDVANAQLDGRTAQLHGEIAQDVADIESARARVSFSQESLSQAREGLRLAQFGYDRGALGTTDVLLARNELAAAQSESTQASADLAASIARLNLIVGASTTP